MSEGDQNRNQNQNQNRNQNENGNQSQNQNHSRIARGVKALFGARLISVASNAVLLLLLTRYLLDPASYGLLYFALSVLSVAAMIGMIGLPKSTGRYITEYTATDEGQIPHIIQISLGSLLVIATVVGIALALLAQPVSNLLGNPTLQPFLVVGGVFVVVRSLATYLTNVFQGFNRVDYSALMTALSRAGRVVFAVGLVLLGLGALGALIGYVAGYAVAVGVGLVILARRFYRDIEPAGERADGLARRILEYSVPTAATRASVVLDSRVDKIIIGTIVGPAAVGYYTLATQIADFCIVPAQSLGFTISPAIGEQDADDQTENAASLYERSMESVLLLYLPAAVGLALLAEPAIRLIFSQSYLGAVPVLQLFSIFIIVRAIHKITGNGLDYLGLARIRAIARGTAAIGNLALNLLLVPLFGIMGAAVATLVTYSAYTAVNVVYIHRELGIDTSDLLGQTARIAAIALLMGSAVGMALPYVTGIVTLAGAVGLGVLVWAVLSIASGLLDPAEVRSFLGQGGA